MTLARPPTERIALFIIGCIALAELVPIVPPLLGASWGFVGLARLAARPGTPAAWILAAVVVVAYVAGAIRSMPGLRERLGSGGMLRLAAIVLAVAAGITEEIVFRKAIMDGIDAHGGGVAVQIVASALTFGAAHGVWGLFGGRRVARGATLWTGALGAALAIVYVVGGRALLPCIVAHAAIDLVLEPGLVLAALSRRHG